MIFIVLVGALALTCLLPFLLPKHKQFTPTITQILLFGLILVALGYGCYQQDNLHYALTLLQFNQIALKLAVQFDTLSKIMTIFILLIGFVIYRYAQNYLDSDNTKIRFLSQYILVILSVLLLVSAENLLTAFVAWQFIGISLYLLLNHYHHDPAANRAAKKKFVINRVGDCCFLLAIIIAFHTNSSTSFASIQASAHSQWICTLLFISVMTKCAQFPFHLWLIDTMEAPTPVSALMHAGVINAGGILLTRISGTLVGYQALSYLILLTGLLSAILSIHWMNQQPDIKKKLAYSTMGQMGYMLAQCSLGAFPAAIFHLISHGFYKASLFLNSGETLNEAQQTEVKPISALQLLLSSLLGTALFLIAFMLLKDQVSNFPPLMYGFMLLTIITTVVKTNTLHQITSLAACLSYLLITALFAVYLYCFGLFSRLLPEYDHPFSIPLTAQLILFAVLSITQYSLWLSAKAIKFDKVKDKTEAYWRRFILTPLRVLGETANKPNSKKLIFVFFKAIITLTTLGFVVGLVHSTGVIHLHFKLSSGLTYFFLVIGIYALVIANRCLSIRSLILYLVLFELAFTNIAFFDDNGLISNIGLFHLINVSAVLMMLILLAKKPYLKKINLKISNRFPTRVFYLVFGLLLLIGIPGTASFISEFYLLSSLMNNGVIAVFLYASLIVLIAVVVTHSLQLYAFDNNYSMLLSQAISPKEHIIFLLVIALNIFCGIHPDLLLKAI